MVEILNLYNPISNSDKQLFESKVVLEYFKKGDFLLFNEEVQDKLYLIKEGLTMMYFDNDDKRKVIDFAYQNRFCADINSFSNKTPSIHCIECLEHCRIQYITYENLIGLFDSSKEIERAYKNLLEKILCSVLQRHLDLSILTIEERFANIVSKRPELFRLVPHKYIASYLNIDPTNFSKLYKNFAKNPIKFY